MHNLDAAFSALADPTRRAILARLAKGEATVNELAEPFEMTQPAISQHLKVLEDAGLIVRRVEGTKRPRRLAKAGIEAMDQWLAMLRKALDKLRAAGRSSGRDGKTQEREKAMSKMTLKTEGDTHVIVTRRFAAPPEAVYRAHTEPKLIQKWLLGPEGWTMPVCINEAKAGGKFRYEWTNGKGGGFHITGEYLELEPYNRIVHVERMHLPDPTPDNHIETRFEADGAGTLMTMRMTLPDDKTRAASLATGMERS